MLRVLQSSAGLALLLALATGCQHVGNQSSARTLDKGKSRLSATVGGGTWSEEHRLAPIAQGRIQYGIEDHVEFTVSGGTDGLGGEVKVSLLRAPSALQGLNLSLAPGLSVGPSTWGSDPYGLRSTVQLPLYVGYRMGGHELTLSPRFAYITTLGVHSTSALLGGATLGATFRMGGFTLTPEFGALHRLLWAGNVGALLPVVNLGFGWE